MFRRVILKGILGRKARLFITSIAVILGTAFLSGTSVFSATLNRTFDNLFQDVFKNIDGYVRSTEVVEGDFGLQERTRIPLEMVDKVREVPGVADVSADIQAFARIIAKDGKPLGSEGNGPPTQPAAAAGSPISRLACRGPTLAARGLSRLRRGGGGPEIAHEREQGVGGAAGVGPSGRRRGRPAARS